MSANVGEMLAELEAEVHGLRELVADVPTDAHVLRVHNNFCTDAAVHVANMLSRARSLRAMFDRVRAHHAVPAPKLIQAGPDPRRHT